MQLVKLEARNFRCLKSVSVLFGRLTVLIGENDAGKSSLLDLLEMSLGTRQPDEHDFFCWEEVDQTSVEGKARRQTPFIEADLEFKLDGNDEEAKLFALDGAVNIRKHWTPDTVEFTYRGEQVEDDRLAQDFSKLRKADLEVLIEELEPEASASLKTNPERIEWLKDRAHNATKRVQWLPVTSQLSQFLPRFERYRALDYSSPDSIVMKTLRQVYEQVIYEPEGENKRNMRPLDKRLRVVKKDAETRIHEKVQDLLDFIRRYAPQVEGVSYEPTIDFSGGLKNGDFLINDGRGSHYLSKIGDGTKRRVFMATLDWDRHVNLQQAAKDRFLPEIIRGYDEPDSNLHYEAQRLMYRSIADIAEAPGSRIQAILCTHSLTLIDRAPAKSINLLRLRDGSTTIDRLETDNDPGVEAFLTDMARELGISNSLMFYEKSLVLVEGETEENALPMLYRTLHGRSFLEDGIRVINTKSNGAVKEFLRLMSKNRQEMITVLLDRDTEKDNNGREAKLTKDVFRQSGFSEAFIDTRIIYVGKREFEDSFSNTVLATALQNGWPKGVTCWTEDDIAALRNQKKFSDALGQIVYKQGSADGQKWSKPELGKHLGRACNNPDDIPKEIKKLFETARTVACCHQSSPNEIN